MNMQLTQELVMDEEMLTYMGFRGTFERKNNAFKKLLQPADYTEIVDEKDATKKYIVLDNYLFALVFRANVEKFNQMLKQFILLKSIVDKYQEYSRLFDEYKATNEDPKQSPSDLLRQDFEKLKLSIDKLEDEISNLAFERDVFEKELDVAEKELARETCELKLDIEESDLIKDNLDKRIRDITKERREVMKLGRELQQKRKSVEKAIMTAKRHNNTKKMHDLEIQIVEFAKQEEVLSKNAINFTAELDVLIRRMEIFKLSRSDLAKREDELDARHTEFSQQELEFSRKSWIIQDKSNLLIYERVLNGILSLKIQKLKD